MGITNKTRQNRIAVVDAAATLLRRSLRVAEARERCRNFIDGGSSSEGVTIQLRGGGGSYRPATTLATTNEVMEAVGAMPLFGRPAPRTDAFDLPQFVLTAIARVCSAQFNLGVERKPDQRDGRSEQCIEALDELKVAICTFAAGQQPVIDGAEHVERLDEPTEAGARVDADRASSSSDVGAQAPASEAPVSDPGAGSQREAP